MEIRFKQLNLTDEEDFKLIADWDNNDEIKYFIRPNFNEGEIENITSEEIIEGFRDSKRKKIFMIICDDKKMGYKIIGEFSEFIYYNGEWCKDIRMEKYIW